MTVTGGYPNIAVTTITAVTRPPCKGNPPAVFPAAVLVAEAALESELSETDAVVLV